MKGLSDKAPDAPASFLRKLRLKVMIELKVYPKVVAYELVSGNSV
jgi:hypothetical protein